MIEALDVPPSPHNRRFVILAICCISVFMAQIDNTIINVALPSIGRQFHAPLSGLQWIVDGYTLVLASLLIIAGSTGDRLGRRRVLLIGLSVFTIGSLACSVAPGLGWLVAFRMLQATGGSMLNPVAMSIIRNSFVNPRERAHAIGIWGAMVGIAMALGPIVGGILVQSIGWRSIFWVNAPVGIVAIILTSKYVPESKALWARRPDFMGQFLITVLLASLTYAIIEGPSRRWDSPEIRNLFSGSIVILTIFVLYELRRDEPLVQMRFFKSAPFSGATAVGFLSFIAFGGFLFLNTLYLQDVRGLSPFHVGVDMLPMAGTIALASSISGRVVGRFGARPSLVFAGLGLGIGSLLMTDLTARTPFTLLFSAYAIFGIGVGLVNAPITITAISGMPAGQAGVAAAIASTSRQIGQTFGVGIAGSMAVSGVDAGLATPRFADATHVDWWLFFACGCLVVTLALASTTNWSARTARRTAIQFDLEGN